MQDSIASATSSARCSIGARDIEDKGARASSVPPLNASRVVGSSYGSDDDSREVAGRKSRKARAGASSVIDIDDNSSDDKPAPKESDEAERGMILSRKSI